MRRDADGHCGHVKPDRTRCRAKPLPGKARCVFHDPGSAAARADGRRRGGVTRAAGLVAKTLPPDAPDLPLRSVADVTAALAEAYNGVRTGRLDARVGNCLGVLAGVLLKAIEGGELERRVADLEAAGTRGDAMRRSLRARVERLVRARPAGPQGMDWDRFLSGDPAYEPPPPSGQHRPDERPVVQLLREQYARLGIPDPGRYDDLDVVGEVIRLVGIPDPPQNPGSFQSPC